MRVLSAEVDNSLRDHYNSSAYESRYKKIDLLFIHVAFLQNFSLFLSTVAGNKHFFFKKASKMIKSIERCVLRTVNTLLTPLYKNPPLLL